MDKFEEQEMKKIKPIIWKCFDWLINKNVMAKKRKAIRDKLKHRTFNNFWILFGKKRRKKEKES